MELKDALNKVQKYCAYYERSVFEVKRKLYEWGVEDCLYPEIIDELRKDNFLSEDRFAELYARSKVNQKKWGRIKIRMELKKHEIPHEIIDDAIAALSQATIVSNMETLSIKKLQSLRGDDQQKNLEKLKMYLYSKGYEPALIIEYLNKHNYIDYDYQ